MEESLPHLQLPSAPFPAPPPFWKHFTTNNAERLKELRSESEPKKIQSIHNSQNILPALSSELPIELTYLQPPPPPTASNSSFPAFNVEIPVSPNPPPLDPSIALFDITSPNLLNNLPFFLKRLTISVLLNFQELTTILCTPTEPPIPPEQSLWQNKIEDIRRLLMNALYCVNFYRPHQARESVIKWLEEEVEKGEEEARKLDQIKEKILDFLESVEGDGTCGDIQSGVNEESALGLKDASKGEDTEVEQARRLWKAIRELDDG